MKPHEKKGATKCDSQKRVLNEKRLHNYAAPHTILVFAEQVVSSVGIA